MKNLQQTPSAPALHDGQVQVHLERVRHWHETSMNTETWLQLTHVAPTDAAMLLCQFDPDNIVLSDAAQTSNNEIGFGDLIRLNHRFTDLQNNEPASRTLLEWLDIAEKMGLKHHSWIKAFTVSAHALRQPQRDHRRVTADDWCPKARDRALEIIVRQRAKNLFPSQVDIADEIAREFRRDGVFGVGGKPLTGAYIKRHGLKNISSAVVKRMSTANRRGS